MLSNRNKQHRKNQYSTSLDLINTDKSLTYPFIFSLWHSKIKNLHKTENLEMEKTYLHSSEILETESPKNEKFGKIVRQKF